MVGKVDVDANQEFAAKYGVRNIPTVLLFKDGEKRCVYTLKSVSEICSKILALRMSELIVNFAKEQEASVDIVEVEY